MISFATSFVTVGGVDGDYLEFGVYQGESFINAWNELHGTKRRLFAYDSFAGLPDPDQSEVDRDGEFAVGEFAYAQAGFERNLRRAGVDRSRVTIVPGFYEETLRHPPKEHGVERAAIVWIDCDLYESARLVLDYLTSILVDGAVLIFDDWFCFRARSNKGEQRACAEWLERNQHLEVVPYRDFHWGGKSFIVHRQDGSISGN
ncbi:MAG: TylF/MycF/NovP-related O-methyltransferase [Acidimicrobiales bacterium]